jgi:hypothetical protein
MSLQPTTFLVGVKLSSLCGQRSAWTHLCRHCVLVAGPSYMNSYGELGGGGLGVSNGGGDVASCVTVLRNVTASRNWAQSGAERHTHTPGSLTHLRADHVPA